MKCEIRNLTSSETYSVPAEGFVFGRAGGPANITISDQSVSKRHARVFMKDGQWFLEDLKSVNGTVVNNRRITEPVAIQPGFTFSLSKHQFEVTNIEGASAPRARESDPRRSRPSQAPQQAQQRRPPQQDPMDVEPLLPPEQSRSRPGPSMQPVAGTSRQMPQDEPVAEDPYLQEAMGGGGGGAAEVMAAIPRAIGYYLANVPLMLVNPIGTINKGVAEQKVKAMRPIELIAFAIPAYLAAFIAGNVATFVATAVAGQIAVVGFIISSAISAAIAVVAGIVYGLIMHPLTKFVVEKIGKGETDDKSRSNYAVMSLVAFILMQGAGALTILFTGVVARLVASVGRGFYILNVIPALVMGVAGIILIYIMFSWARYWRCANWVLIVCKILVVLSLLGALGNVGSAIWGTVQAFRGGVTSVPDVNIPTDGDDKGDDKGDKGDDKGDKGDDKGDKGDDKGDKGDDKGDKGDDKGDKGDKPDHPTKGDDKGDKGDKPDHPTKGDDKGDKGDKPDHPTKGDDKGDKGDKPDHPTKGDDAKAAVITGGSGSDYAAYKQKRTELERRLTENPLLVKAKDKSELSSIGTAYLELVMREKEVRFEARADLAEKKKGKPDMSSLPDAALVEKYVESMLFLKTSKQVDNLYSKLPKE